MKRPTQLQRSRTLIAAVVFSAGPSLALYCLLPVEPSIVKGLVVRPAPNASYEHLFPAVRLGRHRNVIVSILGPPGDYSTMLLMKGTKDVFLFHDGAEIVAMVGDRDIRPRIPWTTPKNSAWGNLVLEWNDDSGIIAVHFRNERATFLHFQDLMSWDQTPQLPPRPGDIEKLLELLR